MAVSFTVHGVARPAGSKRGFYNKKAGRVIVTDTNANSRPWKALVADAALQAMLGSDQNGQSRILEVGPPLEGPLLVEIVFWMPRPKSHYGTGKNAAVLKPSAPRYHTSAPDVLKLARAVEDAMTGIVYRDDAQIACEVITKPYAQRPGCDVRVTVIEQATAETQHREKETA